MRNKALYKGQGIIFHVSDRGDRGLLPVSPSSDLLPSVILKWLSTNLTLQVEPLEGEKLTFR